MENESVGIKDGNIRITGFDLNMEYYRKIVKKKMEPGFIKRTLGDSSKKEFQILIAHNGARILRCRDMFTEVL